MPYPFILAKQNDIEFFVTSIPARELVRVAYAAVRGIDSEEGAVQRVLNVRRISSIKEFALQGGDFPNSVVLNWSNQASALQLAGTSLSLPDGERMAQLIDGQHRVAGLKEAIEAKPAIGDLSIPVSIYQGLSTKKCADLFLAINTEQKPVPRSLVFDLYGIASEEIIDKDAFRARDVAMSLHEDPASPYYELIKLPGAPQRKGGIALSTAVAALRPMIEEKGDLDQIGIRELEMQRKILLNFFSALKRKYHHKWGDKNNAFMFAAGFTGGIDFLRKKMIPYCNGLKSFTIDTMSNSLRIGLDDLITQQDVKGIGGKDAPRRVYERLVAAFVPENQQTSEIEI